MTRIAVLGAGGRMGRAIIADILAAPDLHLAGAVERPGHPACGVEVAENAAMVVCANAAPVAHKSDVLIDFSTPDALDEHLRAALDANVALVVGTTGLEARHHAALDKAARSIPILQAANTSLGVTLMLTLMEQAARSLGPEWDIEILDWHHRHKVDAPSGTALALGEAAARGRGGTLEELRLPPHDGIGEPRKAGGIGFASLRGGSVAGQHQALLASEGERLIITHEAEDRRIFAHGAVAAARWLAGRPADRYYMRDVLGL